MSIRAKLAWTFMLLLIFGITAISSYSILFIRNYLLNEGEKQILDDSAWLSITLRNLQPDEQFETNLNELALASGYRIAVYDRQGYLFAEAPYHTDPEAPGLLDPDLAGRLSGSSLMIYKNQEDNGQLVTFTEIETDNNPAAFLRVSIYKDQIYEPIKTIRWIIYTGMFISMGLVILVSILFSRSISRPILQLEDAARKIADGNTGQTLNLDRKDEFGKLAASLNRMAEKLRSDNLELKRLNQKQRQFFADITHEIRNPLHTIAGSLEMLQAPNLKPAQRKKTLHTAQQQALRINRLFKDLVTLQRYDSDDQFIHQQPFQMEEVISLILEIYEAEAEEKGIELSARCVPVMVIGDKDKIEQVLENLVSNAIKFTGSGKITIQTAVQDGVLLTEVRDTGIGISAEHLDRLFDRFYRTDKARSRDKGGTGLGLAVVKSILDAHQSEIRVESTPDRGSVFRFTLPLA